jgi:hypothetical protein
VYIFRNFSAILTLNPCVNTAKRCNEHGEFVISEEPPAPPTLRSETDWAPFDSRVGFELAEFIYAEAELSKKKANRLLELWAATLVPHGTQPPIKDYADLLQKIDSVPLGNIPWECFSLGYDGPPSETTHTAEWKTAKYEVWFRNPREVIKGILGNVEFDGHIDYSAYQEFEGSQRLYSNMMSGNWVWRQSVRYPVHTTAVSYLSWDRIQLLRIVRHMVRCLCRSFLDQIRQLFPLQQVKTSTILSTSQLATYKII